MSPELEPMQRLVLWLLAVSPGGGMLLKDMSVKLVPVGKRKILATQGLTRETGRPIYLELTDLGWLWCQEHLTESLNTRSPRAQSVLQGLTQVLASYFKSQDQTVSIGQLIQQARQFENLQKATRHSMVEVEQAIKSACLQLGTGNTRGRVRLANLRPLLSDFSREEVDQAIFAMEDNGTLTAMRLDNPDEISSEDREAVLRTPAGSESHILYLQGESSCQLPL